MQHAVLCQDLHKTYDTGKNPVRALAGLTLEVARGECFGLLGPNGAGKTTTVEILEGLLEPTSGEVRVLGSSWGEGRDQELRERLGITLQESKLPEKLSVRETLQLFRSFYPRGLSPNVAMELVSLQEKSDAWVRKLSGGQKQRLTVACALVGQPELLFLDEPTTGLDPQARRQLWEVVNNLKQEGNTIVLTTHYMDEAEKLCDRVAVIDHGQVIAMGSPHELISRLGGEHIIEFTVEADDSAQIEARRFLHLPTVTSASREASGFLLTVSKPHLSIPALLAFLESEQLQLRSLTTRHVNLEDVFVSLTGRHLRDA